MNREREEAHAQGSGFSGRFRSFPVPDPCDAGGLQHLVAPASLAVEIESLSC